MSTWAGMLADIRAELKDSGTTPRWTDEVLFLFAKDAIRAYSADLPRFIYHVTLTAQGGRFALPADFLDVSTVELSPGVYLEPFTPRPGRRFIAQAQATKFFTSGGYLYLDTPPQDGDTVILSYHAMHALPSSEDDFTTMMTIPAEDEELVRLYVRAKVAEQMRLAQSSLDRFRPGTAERDDNPLQPEYAALMKEFKERVALKLGGTIQLYAYGRHT